MNRIRIVFLILFVLVFIVSFVIFNTAKSSFDSKVVEIADFQITEISGSGRIYYDSKKIKDLSKSNPFDLRKMNYSGEIYVKADPQTSFEFYHFGTFFTALPDSHIYYQPKTREFCFFRGELYWYKELKDKTIQIPIKNEEDKSYESTQKIITLSDSGKIKISGNSIEIWNYSGDLKFNIDDKSYNLPPNNLLISRKRQKIRTFRLLSPPESISPEDRIISLDKPEDAIVKFNWKTVIGARNYAFKLYSSSLRENVLYKTIVSSNKTSMNLLEFEDVSEFYWQVFPYDEETYIESSPSKMGHIKLVGRLLDKETILKPPSIKIISVTVSGNMVLIKGEADVNCQLFINEDETNIDNDGTFLHTLSFETIGVKRIVFRLISPTKIETTVERQVRIFAE